MHVVGGRLLAFGGVGIVAVAVGAGMVAGPVVTLAVTAAVAIALVVALRPLWTVHAALFLALTTLPTAVPYALPLGSKSLFLFEPLLYTAAACVAWKLRIPTVALRPAACLGVVAAYGAVRGYVAGYPRDVLISEVRPLVACAATLLITASLIRACHTRPVLRTLCVSLWVSLTFTVVGSATGLPLNGRIETAGLFVNGRVQSADALRLLTPSSHVADAVLCVCVALLITGRVRLRPLVPFLVPALVLSFLSYSRNTLLAVGAAVVVAVLATRSMRIGAGLLRIVGSAAAVAVVLAVFMTAPLPGRAWAQRQEQAFQTRVIAGAFDASVRHKDASAQARQVEDRYADAAIATAPVTGHGFGFAYRPAFGAPTTFTAMVGPYYVHDFYRWVVVTTGLLGLALWGLAVLPALVRQLLRGSPQGIAFAAATAGLIGVCLVAPLPTGIDDGGAVTAGAVLGGLVASAIRGRSATRRVPG